MHAAKEEIAPSAHVEGKWHLQTDYLVVSNRVSAPAALCLDYVKDAIWETGAQVTVHRSPAFCRRTHRFAVFLRSPVHHGAEGSEEESFHSFTSHGLILAKRSLLTLWLVSTALPILKWSPRPNEFGGSSRKLMVGIAWMTAPHSSSYEMLRCWGRP
ncbi:hypothetical protein Y1Q_0003578 [Alligator mississippiensis]|uniref:Uncharacterized protein n=1 Tax=Alligator mississippiensis TaxID=8496 RepID=A0A151NGR1_ALLMI|nr:hypothetical protein Y1Q_0003578 [Alligator mississippiensis]